MKNLKCHRCGLVNFAGAENCKQCKARLGSPYVDRHRNRASLRLVSIFLLGAIAFGAVYLFVVRPEKQKAAAIMQPEIDRAARLPKRDEVIKLLEAYLGTSGEAPPDGNGRAKGYGPCGAIISYQYDSVGIDDETSYSGNGQTTNAFPVNMVFTKTASRDGREPKIHKYTNIQFAVAKDKDGQWQIVEDGTLGMTSAEQIYSQNKVYERHIENGTGYDPCR